MSRGKFDPTKMKILESFRITRKRFFTQRFWEKDIFLAYQVSKEIVDNWKRNGFWKSNHLLKFLETRYAGLGNFKLILFEKEDADDFYEVKENGVTDVYLNYQRFIAYCREIDSFLRKLTLVQLNYELQSMFNTRISESYFNKMPADELKKQLNTTHFKIIETILKEYNSLSNEQKQSLFEAIEHSTPGTELVQKYITYKPDTPEIQLKLFMQVIDKLGPEGFAELAKSVLSGDKLIKLSKEIENLSLDDQTLLIRNVPHAARLLNLCETLKTSIIRFETIIEKHKKSKVKNETEIHSFLSSNYWLLGVDYFDKVIETSINEFGKKINETAFYNFTAIPDFTIKMINGDEDECVVIELEEANDMIFKKDGNLSKKVFDGINQAMIYVVLKKVERKEARGIAVIGSAKKLGKRQKEQVRILRNSYPLVKILTYEDMISNASTVIKFLEKYKTGCSTQ